MNDTLLQAIFNKQRLVVTYNGTERLVEPHTYGLDKNGSGKLRVHQISESEEHGGWRLFSEELITDVRIADEQFSEPRSGYSKDDRHIETIYAQL
jgi:predicted DNA-binding transcriptional regulator YafY